MSDNDLPEDLQELVSRYMTTMDHVALLLALREDQSRAHESSELATSCRLDRAVADLVLRELASSNLVRAEGSGFRYDPAPEVRPAVERLAEMYRTKPVTLVRAIYDRPARAAQTFASAFRLRKEGE